MHNYYREKKIAVKYICRREMYYRTNRKTELY